MITGPTMTNRLGYDMQNLYDEFKNFVKKLTIDDSGFFE